MEFLEAGKKDPLAAQMVTSSQSSGTKQNTAQSPISLESVGKTQKCKLLKDIQRNSHAVQFIPRVRQRTLEKLGGLT